MHTEEWRNHNPEISLVVTSSITKIRWNHNEKFDSKSSITKKAKAIKPIYHVTDRKPIRNPYPYFLLFTHSALSFIETTRPQPH